MEGSGKALAARGGLSNAKALVSTVLFSLYRSHMAGVVAVVVTDHTREALFQLACDLRTNTPKDARFVSRHASALVPRTAPGWLALCSALSLGFSGAVALACTTVLLSLAGVWSAVGLAIASGVFLACVLAMLALSLFVATLVSGAMAASALAAYCTAITMLGCFRVASRLLLGSPRTQPARASDQNQCSAVISSGSVAGTHASSPQQAAALPSIRTQLPPKQSTMAAQAMGSPPASPRKAHPAAAAAAAVLGEQHTLAAGRQAPAAPSPDAVSHVVSRSRLGATTDSAGSSSTAAADRTGSLLAGQQQEALAETPSIGTPPATAVGGTAHTIKMSSLAAL